MASTSSNPVGSNQPDQTHRHQNTSYHPNPSQKQLGNLGNILTHYEYSQQQSRKQHETNESDPNNYSNIQNHTMHNSHQNPPGALTINIPTQHPNISSWGLPPDIKEEGERDRSSTLGSEFDLGWALGKDGRGLSISGLLTPLSERDEGMSESTSTTAISGSTSTTANSAHVGVAATGSTSSHLPSLMENTTSIMPEPSHMSSGIVHHYATNESAGRDGLGGSAVGQIHESNIQYRAQHNQSPSDQSQGSASMFLNGVFKNQNHSTGHKPSQQQRFHAFASNSISIQQPQQQKAHPQIISHTPPTYFGTSYENSHFGKRMRSGSISGRLRSASDLEDSGIISSAQKSVLKDLIIAGNDSVQGAIDKYESGDPSALEEMIKSGALAKSQDIDLLGDLDLDLDFLNVHEDEEAVFGVGEMDDLNGNDHSTEDTLDHGKTSVQPLAAEPIDSKSYDPGSRRPPSQSDDGIGDLEFNGYDSTADSDSRTDSSRRNVLPSISQQGSRALEESLEIHRMRANSLAFPGLLLDDSNPEDVDNLSFGQWMDPDVARPTQAHANASVQAQHIHPPNIVDANGSLYILNPSQLTNAANNATNGLTPTGISTPGASSFTMQCEMLMQREMQRQQMQQQQQQQQQQKHGIAKGKSTKKKESKSKKEKVPKEKKEKKTSSPKEKKTSPPKEKKEPREKKAPSKKKSNDTPEPMATNAGKSDNNEGEGGEEEREEVPSGLGRPRTMSDPNLIVRLDDIGLLHVDGPEGWVGAYSPDSRQIRINKFLEKRNHRVWVKKVKYDVRKNFADSRLRVKGRFVKKEDEMLMRELMSLT